MNPILTTPSPRILGIACAARSVSFAVVQGDDLLHLRQRTLFVPRPRRVSVAVDRLRFILATEHPHEAVIVVPARARQRACSQDVVDALERELLAAGLRTERMKLAEAMSRVVREGRPRQHRELAWRLAERFPRSPILQRGLPRRPHPSGAQLVMSKNERYRVHLFAALAVATATRLPPRSSAPVARTVTDPKRGSFLDALRARLGHDIAVAGDTLPRAYDPLHPNQLARSGERVAA